MQPSNPKADATAEAIAYLTAMYETPDRVSNPLTDDLLRRAVESDDAVTLLVGFMNISNWLLVKLEKATGQTVPEVLQDMARRNEGNR